MKWVTKDCCGNTKVWYSEDVIERIKKKITEYQSLKYPVSSCVPLEQILYIIKEGG